MLKRVGYIILSIILLSSCRGKDTANTIVSGVVPTYAKSKIYISRMLTKKSVVLDSTVADSLGNFTFRMALSAPDFFQISNIKNGDGLVIIATPKDQIEITLAKGQKWESAVVKGSAGSNGLTTLNESLSRFKVNLAGIQKQFDTLKYSYKYDSLRRVLKDSFNLCFEHYRTFLRNFVTENSGSIASIAALYQKQDSLTYFLNEHSDIKYFLLADSVLHRRYPESAVVKAFHAKMEGVRTQLNNLKLVKESIREGEDAPNFTLKSLSGDTVSLARYKGRYVLLEFWASWAKTSALQNASLAEVYQKYKPYGFEIVQVSLDRNLDELERAITPVMRQWKHVSEFKMWNSSIVKEYRVGIIPSNFIINRQGVVVAKNVLNKNLYDTLRWYLVRPYLIKRDSLLSRESNTVNTSDR